MPLLVPLILLVGGVLSLWLDRSRPRLGRGIGWGSWGAASAAALAEMLAFEGRSDGLLWRSDEFSSAAVGVGLTVALLARLAGAGGHAAGTALWNAGLLALCGVAGHPALLWAAMQSILVPRLFSSGRNAGRLAPEWTGSILLAVGSLLIQVDTGPLDQELPRSIGVGLVVCGLGGLLGWFPFPKGALADAERETLPGILGSTLLPVLIGSLLLFRTVTSQPLTDQQIVLLAVPALFSLVLCAARLPREQRSTRRFRLASLAILSSAALTLSLVAWETSHPDRLWHRTSNVPSGRTLFLSLFLCESAGLLAALFGCRLLTASSGGNDSDETLAGAVRRRPFAGWMTAFGVLSLAGIPPLPGCWWRFGLVTALVLPHRTSFLTGLVEIQPVFIVLAVAWLGAWGLLAVGHMRLFCQLVFDEPFRVRGKGGGFSLCLGAALALALLAACMLLPFARLGLPEHE